MVFIKVDKLLFHTKKMLSYAYAAWFSLKWRKTFHTKKMLSYAAWFSLKWRSNYSIQKTCYLLQHGFHSLNLRNYYSIQKKVIFCSMVFIKLEKLLFHTQKMLSHAAWFSLKVEK
jgi:hypothetical protein